MAGKAMVSPDIHTLSSLQNRLSHLTGLSLSLYEESGKCILPAVNENKILSLVKSTADGRKTFHDFLRGCMGKAVQRNDISLFQCPAGQYHFFIPLRCGKSVVVITGGGVYLSRTDFETFYKKQGPSYGMLPYQIKEWYPEIAVREYAHIQDSARHISSLFELFLRQNHKDKYAEKRYRLMKIIISLIAEIRFDQDPDDIYTMLLDIILFLFTIESVSLLGRDRDTFVPLKAAGRIKDQVQPLPVNTSGILSEIVEKQRPLYSESLMDIFRMGYTEEVTSVHAFPIVYENQLTGVLNVLNSEISPEDAEIIFEICKITGFIIKLIRLTGSYHKYLREIEALNTATERIVPVKEPDMLYEAILDTSVHLAAAEKGSLMLADNGEPFLTIKAAKGIQKRLMGEIKVRAGEGIAGWVFREGIPLIIDDIEKHEQGFSEKRPKYRTGSLISIPLKIGEKTIGVLNISDKITGEVFSEEDMVLLRSFASFATVALERANYYSLAGHLRELSITDSLTGLFNRRYFEERFFEEIQRSKRHSLSFALAMIDVDNFKLFNDSEGHLAGDEVLKSIANIAKDCLRVIDVIARFGGEEFAVIMPQTAKDEAFLVAERIRQSVKEQLPATWKRFPEDSITISIGIACFPSDGNDRKLLIRNADRALYRAKMSGKDRTVIWES
jgi:diguanylate cyclase (GGDEF)-like protein